MTLKESVERFIADNQHLKKFEIERKLNISKTTLVNILNGDEIGTRALKNMYMSGALNKYNVEEFNKINAFRNLSVLMMVKNEEKNIERCLKSLSGIEDPLLREIIIVDTGSTDNTINIIKSLQENGEYPFDRIKLFHKKWNNDFSAIRNYTIELANGTWLFFIDADEELKEATGINRLVKEDNPDYHVGLIQVINFMKKDLSQYASMVSPRIFRNTQGFKYEGKVHNQPKYPTPYNTVKLLSSINHYGYFNDDKKLQLKKFKRTVGILEKELKKDSNNHYYWYQMAQSHKMIGEYQKAKDFIETAIDIQKGVPNYYGVKASLELILKEYDEAIKTSYNGLEYEPEFVDLWYFMAEALRMKKEYQKAINVYNIFLDLIHSFDQLSISSKSHIVVHTMSKVNDASNKLITLTATLALQAAKEETK